MWPILMSGMSLYGDLKGEIEDFPVLYKGRFRPADVYARLWLYDFYHSQAIKNEDLKTFRTSCSSALPFLWQLNRLGHQSFICTPLFWVSSAEIKQLANLDILSNRFNYQELNSLTPTLSLNLTNKEGAEFSQLVQKLKQFSLIEQENPQEQLFQERLKSLQVQELSPQQIEATLEQEFPLVERLKQAGTLFKALPGKYGEGDWISLKAFKIKIFDKRTNCLKPIGNFTLYSNENFERIRDAYFAWEKALSHENLDDQKKTSRYLGLSLKKAYATIAGHPYQKAAGKALYYPTLNQLYAEYAYYQFPWIKLLIVLYGFSAIFLMCFKNILNPKIKQSILMLLIVTFILHTSLLLCRCYILNRPPVTNMFETVIYIPWVATLFSLTLAFLRRNTFVLFSASLSSFVLLVILEVADLNQSLDQVQAVLDSQFWLLIHVLIIVGSYGIFILGSVLGHFYLCLALMHSSKTSTMRTLSQLILQILYVGTAFLITGTILGGVWAAESWGRFWDWDPKESWAFISICLYLICIHAYRFHQIREFGLAFGAVIGFLAISFTWYGVNYILGTGLHSYGFGSGGEKYYYSFLLSEILFLISLSILKIKSIYLNKKEDKP
ncbi:cytochrome c biogenesis protein [Candidatus Protochlamydia amoebophila]|uniref:cytochrome c biogenesis protein n=1 Tax=Candidatus Protochlamydia amoebophila TaxID=362787 RepID=UPI001BC9163B|nr:cytochrome c biogenesis protein CcsA [Candidatus Protochlamydia amoebophila]